jgi:hypothetical protein
MLYWDFLHLFCSFAAALAWVAVAALAVPCFKALTPRPFIIAAIT